jgi:formate-dependent nitrite reductase membrane component NrfD
MFEFDIIRHNPGIDPSAHFWGWEVPVDLFLGGTTAGLMILTAVLALRPGAAQRSAWIRWLPFGAPVMIALALFCLMLDLSHKPHLYRFYLTFEPSAPMSWGSWILLAVFPFAGLFGLVGLRPDQFDKLKRFWPVRVLRLASLVAWFRRGVAAHERSLAWANLALGIALGLYTGVLLSSLGVARPAWNSALMGPLFLASGLTTGAALMLLFPVRGEERSWLLRWNLFAIGAVLALLGLFLLGMLAAGQPGREVVELFLGGPYTALFWALVVTVGLLVPLAMGTLASLRGRPAAALASVLILSGGLSLRWILVLAGQA